MSITTIKHALLSAAVLTSAVAMIAAAPQTHAAPAAARAHRCIMNCVANPTLSLYGHYGSVTITGTAWTPNVSIEITVYLPVSAGGNVTHTAAHADTHGAIDIAWVAPYGCLDQQVEVQAYDATTGNLRTSYAVPGCIG